MSESSHARQIAVLERIAGALEKLAEEPLLDIKVAPPACPSCGVFNPQITTSESSGTGPMNEFVIEMTCQECGTLFWGIPGQWSMHQDITTLRQELQERAANDGRS